MKRYLLVSLFVFRLGLAQESATVEKDLVAELRRAWNEFDYEKSAQLLNVALNAIEHYSPAEQVEIYKFAAFIAFQNNNLSLAQTHLLDLLHIDPTASLDPVTTPPKILVLFQDTKVEYLEDMQQKLQRLEQQQTTAPPSLAFVIPGLEQLKRGYKIKGIVLAASTAAVLGGLVYSYVETGQKKDAYNGEQNPANIPALYDAYNSAYKNQFLFGYALAGLWAASQIDLVLWSRVQVRATVSGASTSPAFFIGLSSQF